MTTKQNEKKKIRVKTTWVSEQREREERQRAFVCRPCVVNHFHLLDIFCVISVLRPAYLARHNVLSSFAVSPVSIVYFSIWTTQHFTLFHSNVSDIRSSVFIVYISCFSQTFFLLSFPFPRLFPFSFNFLNFPIFFTRLSSALSFPLYPPAVWVSAS